MSRIRRLPEEVIQHISAGEVVSNPAGIIKELVENSLDAGASNIEVRIIDGGKTLIEVADDGGGVAREDLPLVVERHATSKLSGANLLAIEQHGFRGEAVAAIASVSRFTLTTRHGDASHMVSVEYGSEPKIRPSPLGKGTKVLVEQLFANLPARLKFLRADRWEGRACSEMVKALALANSAVGFKLIAQGKQVLWARAQEGASERERLRARCAQLMGDNFVQNAVDLAASNTLVESSRASTDEDEDATAAGNGGHHAVDVRGLVSLPTAHRGDVQQQYLFINNRLVKDRGISGAIRAAYGDFLPRGRHPSFVLTLTLPTYLVDVNVHPAKTEVRLRDDTTVRGFVSRSLRQALQQVSPSTSSHLTENTIGAMRYGEGARLGEAAGGERRQAHGGSSPFRAGMGGARAAAYGGRQAAQGASTWAAQPEAQDVYQLEESAADAFDYTDNPLGSALAQLGECYIVARTATGLVLVDQHAAHERIVYERLKHSLSSQARQGQELLVPIIVDVGEVGVDNLMQYADYLKQHGLVIEKFSASAVSVRQMPAILSHEAIEPMVRELAASEAMAGTESSAGDALEDAIMRKLASVACHHSIRGGDELSLAQMNLLLRQIERTPGADQCNHGRPTHVSLELVDIAKIFGRG